MRARLLIGASAVVLAMSACAAMAQDHEPINIAPQSLTTALQQFGSQTATQVMFTPALVATKKTGGVSAVADEQIALAQLLQGTGLTFRREGNTYLIEGASDPQSGSAAGDGAEGTVAALVVTAQKREENIQDVPIAMSAFTQEDLTRSQVATGADLMTQVPNMTFTKTNFTSYSIQIRGIGTQAISATVDPAVAVAFNNTPFLRAHFFEQEFYDMERVEVLRGPQGTLYGRNATAGVVNLISAKPRFHFEAKASADISNYSSHRFEGMLNLPLVEDKIALRLAGAWTKRDGFVTNQLTGKRIDGRDLWSTRVSLRVDPTEKLRANFIWERFEEDDDRLRSGKQTCHRAPSPTEVDGQTTDVLAFRVFHPLHYLDQGCLPASVYSPDAFQTPDGNVLPYYAPLGAAGAPIPNEISGVGVAFLDPYASKNQSRDLRAIESQVEPRYRASSDTVELNVDYDIAPSLTLTSQTGFNRDFLFSTQDYNRFNTRPGAFIYCDPSVSTCGGYSDNPNSRILPDPGGPVLGMDAGDLWGQPCDPSLGFTCYNPGIFCDPQIGCSDRLIAMDLATEHARQFSQEFRVASNFEGPFNFSLGANYLRYKTLEDYYVFINTVTSVPAYQTRGYDGQIATWMPGVTDNHTCLQRGFDYVDLLHPGGIYANNCNMYIDPNPVTDLDGQGHNYFRNQNPYKVQSYALFGEAYYNITNALKLTAGLRWTVDKKDFRSIPSEILIPGYGYPEVAHIKQEWREPTGRLVLTWKPHLGFTDETMVYGSYTHGYKAGGANPPGAALLVFHQGETANPVHPATFKAEFIDAYELGTKNTLLGGRLTSNLTGFYYDYTGYQISEIVDRSAINLNFDAKIWGVEMETDWRPQENLRLGWKLGYEDTRVGDGQKAADLMDRANGGQPDANGVRWMVIKPFPTQASNCVLPTYVVATLIPYGGGDGDHNGLASACINAYSLGIDPVTLAPYGEPPTRQGDVIPADYPGFDPSTAPNNGQGFDKDLSGHALPNAPHWTSTITADYTLPLPQDWLMTLHTDLYYQSEAWTRIFNMSGFDKLKAYTNVNLAAIFTNEERGWTVMAYVKNVFDKDNITGAFLNSDDSGLTNNVFLNEPRLYGLRVTKTWTGSPWWDEKGPARALPLRIELDGYHDDVGGGNGVFRPALADLYDPDFQPPFEATQNDLAALNGGGVRLTYQPYAAWNVSAGVRYGRAGGGTYRFGRRNLSEACLLNGHYCWNPSATISTSSTGKYNFHRYFELTTKNEEAHTIVDFAVGKDFGIGSMGPALISNSLSAGLAYAHFKSSSKATIHGSPDLTLPANFFDTTNGFNMYFAHQHRIDDNVTAGREFEGAGPELDWRAAIGLAREAEQAGRIDLDVGLSATLLFGKQRAAFAGQLEGSYRNHGSWYNPSGNVASYYSNPIGIAPRSKSVTVPGLKANLGLSYSVGGVKVSGGYRIERYYKAIDGGWETRKTYDRTFDGPYMKVSIGFGG